MLPGIEHVSLLLCKETMLLLVRKYLQKCLKMLSQSLRIFPTGWTRIFTKSLCVFLGLRLPTYRLRFRSKPDFLVEAPPPPRGRRRPQDAAVSLRRGLSSCLSPKCNLSLRWGPGSCKGCVRAGKWVPLVLRRLLSCLPPPGASCRQGGSQSRGPREPGPQRAAAEGGSG